MPLNRGAALALAEYAADQRKRREDRADKDAEFQRRLEEAGITSGVEAGLVEPTFAGGRFTGFRAPATPPLNMQTFLAGQGSSALGGLSPYQVLPKFNQFGRVSGYETNALTPQQQVGQGILQASEAPPEAFLTEARRSQIATGIPTTPIVPGPGGGFITSQAPLVEGENYLPGALVDRATLMRNALTAEAAQAKQTRLGELSQLNQLLTPGVPYYAYNAQGLPQSTGILLPKGTRLQTVNPATRPLSAEAATTVTSAEGAIYAIDRLLELEQRQPGVVRQSLIPGAALTGSTREVQSAVLFLDRLRTEVTTARGGKQLTATEIAFLNRLMPRLTRGLLAGDEQANVFALQELRRFLPSIIQRIQGRSAGLAGGGDLTAFVNGQAGGQLMEDANGNRAMVYPDGHYEELP